MADEFIYCPQCGGTKMLDCDYEDENGDNTGEVECDGCGWSGLPEELVCKDDEIE